MAPFNPQISPTSDPSYLSLSKPISEFEGDKSYESMFKGIGDFVSSSVKAADFFVKDTIDKEVFDSVDAERSAYTQATLQVRDAVTGRPLNILGTSDAQANVPEELRNLESHLGNLKNAYGAGKVSQTYYYGRQASIAKALRAKYPGYREYIDSKVSSVLGTNPANAYVSSLLQDINRAGEKVDETYKASRKLIMDNPESLDPRIYLPLLDSGKINYNTLAGIAYPDRKAQADMEARARERLDKKQSVEMGQSEAQQDAGAYMDQKLSTSFSQMNLTVGSEGQIVNNPQQLTDMVIASQTGTGPRLSPPDLERIAESLAGSREMYRIQMLQWGNTPFKGDPQKRTPIMEMGGREKFNELIKSRLETYDTAIDLIKNDKTGAALWASRNTKATLDSVENGLMTKSDLASTNLTVATMRKNFGDTVANEVFTRILRQNKDLPTQMTGFVDKLKLDMVNQPDILLGKPSTFNQAVDQAKAKGITFPKVYNDLISQSDLIIDEAKPDNLRSNVAVSFFDPANQGSLSKFTRDGVDPSTGRQVPGRFYVYDKLTKPEMAQSIVKLDNTTPGLKNNYVNWAEQSFGQDLYSREIMDLRQIQMSPDIRLSYDDKNNRFDVTRIIPPNRDSRKEFFLGSPDTVYASAKKAVERINVGIQGLTNVYKATGEDKDAAGKVIEFMMDMGFDPTAGKGTTFADHMLDRISRSVAIRNMKQGKGTDLSK